MGRRKRSRLITAGLMAPDKQAGGTPAAGTERKPPAPSKSSPKSAAPKTAAPEPAAPETTAAPAPAAAGAPDLAALAEQVKARRREKGWTQADVARNGGPSAGTISQIERCLSEDPAADTLAKLDAGLQWPEHTADAILRGEMAGAH
ncbi:helix-turn-helix domain-containing protein [Nocardia sp. NPDC127579]|uniref:helix-turn-helix domain-containing protein n=1 Tax=Nocardia sp. NPDC127579 TaxID=3345402 RepID=UPI003645F686